MSNVILLNPEFSKGYERAKEEVASGEIYCVGTALMGFASDQADSEFQRGYRLGLLHEHKNGTTPTTPGLTPRNRDAGYCECHGIFENCGYQDVCR